MEEAGKYGRRDRSKDHVEAWPVLPDFQGGLIVLYWDGSLVKLDGTTGQPLTLYTSGPDMYIEAPLIAVHPDGTVFAVQSGSSGDQAVIGIDSTTGAQKFSVPVPEPGFWAVDGSPIIIAGDGYAYIPHQHFQPSPGAGGTAHLGLLRIASSGASDDISIYDYTDTNRLTEFIGFGDLQMITNADTGIVLMWVGDGPHMAITNGTSASLVNAPQLPGGEPVVPVLQAQDGSLVGAQAPGYVDPYMIAFDASEGVRWSVPNYYPLMATADGGVIATADNVSATIFDQNGSAVGQMANMPTQSWTQQSYSSTGGQIAQVLQPIIEWAASYEAIAGGNPSSNCTSVGVVETVEGLPVFALLHWGTSCQWQANGGIKVPLMPDPKGAAPTPEGAALNLYQTEKQKLLDGGYLNGSSCSFFNTSTTATYFNKLPNAITNLSPPPSTAPELPTPYDGLQSNISWYDAGFLSAADLGNATKVSIFKNSPVCGQFVSFKPRGGGVTLVESRTTAASQVYPPGGGAATDMYIDTNYTQDLSQATIVHEALHNVTGMYDRDLAILLGLKPECQNGSHCDTDCPKGSICINSRLVGAGCAGPN